MYLDGSSYKHQKKGDRQKNSVHHGRMSWRHSYEPRKGDFSFVLLVIILLAVQVCQHPTIAVSMC